MHQDMEHFVQIILHTDMYKQESHPRSHATKSTGTLRYVSSFS